MRKFWSRLLIFLRLLLLSHRDSRFTKGSKPAGQCVCTWLHGCSLLYVVGLFASGLHAAHINASGRNPQGLCIVHSSSTQLCPHTSKLVDAFATQEELCAFCEGWCAGRETCLQHEHVCVACCCVGTPCKPHLVDALAPSSPLTYFALFPPPTSSLPGSLITILG